MKIRSAGWGMARRGVVSHSRWWRRRGAGEEVEEGELVHVLAVDDSLVDRRVIERLLKISSCKVTAVESGRRALQFLGLEEEEEMKKKKSSVSLMKVDMIITDYCMPGMTGYELLKKIKGSSTFREIPVVIMSSENVLARIDRCLEEGAEDFIVKPVKLADVKRLKDYMFGQQTEQDYSNYTTTPTTNKRKHPHQMPPPDLSSHPSHTISSPPPPDLSSHPSHTISSPPSSSLDSPTTRLKMTHPNTQINKDHQTI